MGGHPRRIITISIIIITRPVVTGDSQEEVMIFRYRQTELHHNIYIYHDHHFLYQNHHDRQHYLFTQGDYVGSVHQSGGCFRTASSPICGKKRIFYFLLFSSLLFFMQAAPSVTKKINSILTLLLLHFLIPIFPI